MKSRKVIVTAIKLSLFILLISISSDCLSQEKNNNYIANNIPDTIVLCKVDAIIKNGDLYKICADNNGKEFIILTKYDQYLHIQPRKNTDSLEIGKSYKLKLIRLFPPSDNYLYGCVTSFSYKNHYVEIIPCVKYYTTEDLNGIVFSFQP